MQCWFIINVGNLLDFFQDSLMNKNLKKNSIYLKYNVCNNILPFKNLVSVFFVLFF